MNGGTIKHLSLVKQQLESILMEHAFRAIELANNAELQFEIQSCLNDPLSELIENVEKIIENVESGDYDDFYIDEEFDENIHGIDIEIDD